LDSDGVIVVRTMKVNDEKINRKPGYLYYLGKDGYVWASPMKSTKGGSKYRAGTQHVARKNGMYWVGKEGYLEFKAK
jgi:hypothetical protein